VGLRVDVYVQLARKENVLMVPRRAVVLSDGIPLVQVRTAAGVRAQPVRLGAQDGMNVEILEGLREGDAVVY
jgi:HlyD family secretion protein